MQCHKKIYVAQGKVFHNSGLGFSYAGLDPFVYVSQQGSAGVRVITLDENQAHRIRVGVHRFILAETLNHRVN